MFLFFLLMSMLSRSLLMMFAVWAIAQPVSAEVIPLRNYIYGVLPDKGKLIWVAPDGSDRTGRGSRAQPYATPGAASLQAMPGDTIVVASGTYRLFGSIQRSGTSAQPITVRPEPNGRPLFVLPSGVASVDIAASHVQLFGLDISRSAAATTSSVPCLRVTRTVENVSFTDMHVHDCAAGLELSQARVSAKQIRIVDSEFFRLQSFGIRCLADACTDAVLQRVQVRDVTHPQQGGVGVLFGASSTRVLLEESSVLDVEGSAVVIEGTDPLLTSLTVSSSRVMAGSKALVLARGGTLLNSDLRTMNAGVELTGGATYRLRGNLIRSQSTDPAVSALRVVYGSSQQDQPGALLLDGNRIMTGTGRLGLPSAAPGISAPLLTTIKSNTFFFDDIANGVDVPVGRFVSATSFSSATGTGIINLNGNISVVGDPEADDLISPVFQGSQTAANPWSGGVMVFPGARLKGSGATVYLYSAQGQRHAFPSEAVYRSWFTDFRDVTQISDEALSKIPLGRNVTYRPGVRLVKVTTDPKVYAIGAGRRLRWVKTEEVARALFGTDWARRVDDISDAFFINYREGDPIERANDYSPEQERAQIVNPSDTFQE